MTVISQPTGMLNALIGSVQSQVPLGINRDYWVWALSEQNPYQELWIQTIGIPQFERLTTFLLDDVVNDRHEGLLNALASMMNVYLLYETLSDNFAIGCARGATHDAKAFHREDILLHFNDTMIEKLLHRETDVHTMLSPIYSRMQRLSHFEHSLSKKKQQRLAQVFAQTHSTATVEDIEFGGWSMLVANIEAASTTLDMITDDLSYALVRDNLTRRYDGVNQLLCNRDHTFDELLTIGTSTILVPAVLAYYYSIIADLKHNQQFSQEIESGLVQNVLDDSALLIRLLNDIGPALLLNPEHTEIIISELYQLSEQSNHSTSVFELLAQLAEQHQEMTRIKKDMDFNEFNILLDILDDSNHAEAVEQVAYALRTSSELYASLTKRLHSNVANLSVQLGDDAYGKIALRFVGFHEKLYMNDYQLNKGEYAV